MKLTFRSNPKKVLSRRWRHTETNFEFESVKGKGIKEAFALELLLMGDISAPYSDKLKIEKNPAKYLEDNGWVWEKVL